MMTELNLRKVRECGHSGGSFLCMGCHDEEVKELKDALHGAEAIGDFSDELRSRYRLKQEVERLNEVLTVASTQIDSREKEIDKLREALEEIKLGRGAYDQDQFQHAVNTIESMKQIADKALKGEKEKT